MRRILLWAALLLALMAHPASASVVLDYTFTTLADEADEIVHGRVVSQRSYWDEQVIVTEVTLEISECLKGDHRAGERLVIRQQGGAVGDLAMVVPGMPTFVDGEEVVLFLEASSVVDVALVMGLAQGKFSVVTTAHGERFVRRDLQGLTRVAPDGHFVEEHVAPELPTPPQLDRLVADLPLSPSVAEQVRLGPVAAPFELFMTELREALEEPAP